MINADDIIDDIPPEEITVMDRLTAGLANALSPFDTRDSKTTKDRYKWWRDWQDDFASMLVGDTIQSEVRQNKKDLEAEYIRKREQFANENRDQYNRNMEETGFQSNLDTIVAKANANGVESLTDFEKMLYSKIDRDAEGNLVRNDRGGYNIDQSKHEEINSWIDESANSDRTLSSEDLQTMSNFGDLVKKESENYDDIVLDTISGTKKFIYFDEKGQARDAKSIGSIKAELDSSYQQEQLPELLRMPTFNSVLENYIRNGDINGIKGRKRALETELTMWESYAQDVKNGVVKISAKNIDPGHRSAVGLMQHCFT